MALLTVPLLALSVAAAPPSTAEPRSPAAASAEASPEPAGPPPADVPLSPPEILEQPPLVHPLSDDEARDLGHATVTVMVSLDAHGLITQMSVVDADSHAHPALRRAALAVAAQTVFAPARRGDVGVGVRLPIALTFTPPPEAAPSPGAMDHDEALSRTTAEHDDAAQADDHGDDAPDGQGRAAPAAPADDATTLDDPAMTPFEDDGLVQDAFSLTGAGQTATVAGALVVGTAYLVALFSGVTALDNAARVEELAGDDSDELAIANRGRMFGALMLIPVGGPFASTLFSADATTTLLTVAAGLGQVAGLALLLVGAGLWTWGAFADE